jgi:hypothetical protein
MGGKKRLVNHLYTEKIASAIKRILSAGADDRPRTAEKSAGDT